VDISLSVTGSLLLRCHLIEYSESLP